MRLTRAAYPCRILLLLALGILPACQTTNSKIDPFEPTNREVYKFDENLDRWILKPLADGYVLVIPKPLREGIGNGFDNVGYFNVILNDFLQGKHEQGWSDSGRMFVNSTLGLAGFFDPATSMGLVKHDNDFGITLGKWGVEPGPYLVLPLFGPSTARDVTDYGMQIATNPLTYVDMPAAAAIPLNTVQAIDMRARYEQEVRFRDKAAIDPYVFTRDAYLQYREARIHENKPTIDPSMYDEDPGADTQPATQPAK
jgi:phospholipid-binding lipoprotein MlaA